MASGRPTSVHGYPMSVLRSMLQKSVRQADEGAALAAAFELAASSASPAVFRRLFDVGLEDVGWPAWRALADVFGAVNRANARRKDLGLGWPAAYAARPVREQIARCVLLLCRSRHTRGAAWLNMLALQDPPAFAGTPEARLTACTAELRRGIREGDLLLAARHASLLQLAAQCGAANVVGRGAKELRPRVAASALGPAWTELLRAARPEHRPFLVALSHKPCRLRVMTGVLLVLRDPDGTASDPLPDVADAAAVAAAWPASFFRPEADLSRPPFASPEEDVWAADRRRLPAAAPYVDKHVSYQSPGPGLRARLSEAELARSHPPDDALPADACTHRAFVERHAAVKRPHPDEETLAPAAKRAYLEGDPQNRRARDLYGAAYRAAFGREYTGP